MHVHYTTSNDKDKVPSLIKTSVPYWFHFYNNTDNYNALISIKYIMYM